MSIKTKKDKKKDKKENRKKLTFQGTENDTEEHKETKKNDILSMLDRLDNISIAESRVTEGKLRKGLIDSQPIKEIQEQEKNQISISELKEEIEDLRSLKQEYYEKGEEAKSIEIARKIIEKGKESNMKLILNEELEFIQRIQKKITPKKSINQQIDELKKKRHIYYTQEKFDEAIQIAKLIIDLAKEEKLAQILIAEENFINLMEEKIKKKKITDKPNDSIKELKAIKEKGIIDDSLKERQKIQEKKQELIEISKIKEDERKLEEAKEIFKQQKTKFEEEKERFNYEKQMFEEVKKFEREKVEKDAIQEQATIKPQSSELEELSKLEEEKLKLKAEKEKLNQEKINLEEQKKKFEQEKLKFAEEKEAFEWEKKMFEEVKKFETDKDSF